MEVDQVRIRQPPLDPQHPVTGYVDLTYVLNTKDYIILLREGDVVEFLEHDVKMMVSFVYMSNEKTHVEVVSSAMSQQSPVKYEEETDTDDEDLDAGRNPAQTLEIQGDDTQRPYSTSRERQSGSPNITSNENDAKSMNNTPKPTLPDDSEVVQESPAFPRLRQEASTLSGVPESMSYHRLDMSKESQDKKTGLTDDVVESVSGSTLRPAETAETQPDSKVVVAMDRGANDTKDSQSDTDNTHGNKPPALSSSRTNQANTHGRLAESQSEGNISFAELRQAEDEQTAESTREDHQSSVGTTNKITNEYATPAAHLRGTKRKTVVDTALHTTSSKRGKRHSTEAERLALAGGVIIPSSPLTSTSERRSSPRVVISQKDDSSPSSLEAPQYGKENLDGYPGQAPRILFPTESKIPERKGVMKFLKDQKAKAAKDSKPKSFDMLCLENGELKTTAKLLTSLVHNKVIVGEDWVTRSVRAKCLLDPGPFLPTALKDTKDIDRSKIFNGLTVYFTPKLRKDYGVAWDAVYGIAKQAGANVINCPPSKIPEDVQIDLYLASEEGDTAHVAALQKEARSVYNKNHLSHSIVAGKHVPNEDFAITVSEADTTGTAESVGSGKVLKGGKAVKGRKAMSKKKK